MQASRIFIVGSDVVGPATGQGFLEAGHEVGFVDVSGPRVEQLRAEGAGCFVGSGVAVRVFADPAETEFVTSAHNIFHAVPDAVSGAGRS